MHPGTTVDNQSYLNFPPTFAYFPAHDRTPRLQLFPGFSHNYILLLLPAAVSNLSLSRFLLAGSLFASFVVSEVSVPVCVVNKCAAKMMSMTELFYGANEPTWIVNRQQQYPGWKQRGINNENNFDAFAAEAAHVYRSNPYMQRPATSYTNMVAAHEPMTYHDPFIHQQQQLNASDVIYRVQQNQAPKQQQQQQQSPARIGVLQPRNNNTNLHTVHFMVPLCCAHCEKKVKDELMDVDDVERVTCDQWNKRVTVTSTVAPERLLKRVQKIKKLSTFWPQHQQQSGNGQNGNLQQAQFWQQQKQQQQQRQQQQQQAGNVQQNNNRNQVKFQQNQQNQQNQQSQNQF